jgi:hypothetical protein
VAALLCSLHLTVRGYLGRGEAAIRSFRGAVEIERRSCAHRAGEKGLPAVRLILFRSNLLHIFFFWCGFAQTVCGNQLHVLFVSFKVKQGLMVCQFQSIDQRIFFARF